MKIILIFLILILAYTNTAYAKDKVTWGITGDGCESFNSNLLNYKDSEGYELIVEAEIRAFLTGYNMYIGIKDGSADNMKIINQDSSEFIFSYIKNYCRNNKESAVFLGLVDYFNKLK